jgi:hypothetical protein
MTRHPAEYWIKFLLSRREHGFEEIVAMCVAADLGELDPNYLRALDTELRAEAPVPFRGHDLRHRASMTFLRQCGVYDAWHRNAAMRQAMSMLGNAQVRPLMEAFILSPMKPDQAVKKIFQNTGVDVSERAYELFRHYFWNSQLLSMEEWGEFIAGRRVAHKEWLRIAVTAKGARGVQLLLWRTGSGALRHIDSGRMFTDLRNIAYMKALELEHEPADKDNATAFRSYVHSAKMAQEEITASAAAAQDLVDSFQGFHMKSITPKLPSVLQLTAGGETLSEAEDVTLSEDSIKMEDY